MVDEVDDPTQAGLTDGDPSSSVAAAHQQAERQREAGRQLGARLNRERLRLRLNWPAFASLLQVSLGTVYKIATGATARPHELTVVQLTEELDGLADLTPAGAKARVQEIATGGGAAGAMVSDRQRLADGPQD